MMTKELSVNLSRTVKASAKTCFEAWLKPESLQSFMSGCKGISVPRVETEPKAGGSFLIVMQVGETEIPHTGEYKTIRPFNQIVFTWMSPHQTLETSLVTLNFKSIDDKTTEITLSHEGFVSEAARKNHEGGWTNIIDSYVEYFL